MDHLFEKYQNIQLFATKYRNYTLIDKEFYDYETFKNKMYAFEYILHKFKNPKTPEKGVDIYLFKQDSKYINNTTQFKKILDRYKEHHIIMITKEELNVYRRKLVSQYNNLNVKNYLYKHFIIELNKGPLCSKHTILSPEEIRSVSYNIMAHAHKLPAIFESDPQNIWIGGEINDLIKIESYSEITGKSITYRIVTPSSGKVMQVKKTVEKKEVIEDVKEVTEVTEDNNEDYIDDYL
jgi:DNA-directed RNA polymerase subunit H (RpoH/RPB5)